MTRFLVRLVVLHLSHILNNLLLLHLLLLHWLCNGNYWLWLENRLSERLLVEMGWRGACVVRHRRVPLVNCIAMLVVVLYRLHLSVTQVGRRQNLLSRLSLRLSHCLHDRRLLHGHTSLCTVCFLEWHKLASSRVDPANWFCDEARGCVHCASSATSYNHGSASFAANSWGLVTWGRCILWLLLLNWGSLVDSVCGHGILGRCTCHWLG